jgi:hypothetical protein
VTRSLASFGHRLREMSPAEMAWRGREEARRVVWSRRQVHPGDPRPSVPGLVYPRPFEGGLPAHLRQDVPIPARDAVVAAADRLLEGQWELLGRSREDILDPDWFRDPVSGRRAPDGRLAFRIGHRDEGAAGNVKSVRELSRHHHLTVLSSAWWLTHDPRYAAAVDRQLRSWWAANPFLSGIHWTSGVELGVRLLGWVWIRRLLDEWPGVGDLFEANEAGLAQVRWHQEYLADFRSRGRSVNNHEVLEAAGRLAAAAAFPWYDESARWLEEATAQFEAALVANTFPSGMNRELATDDHRFVTETALLVSAEAVSVGAPLSERVRERLVASADAAAALVDETGRPPRRGDGDEGRALVLDDPAHDPWDLLLDLAAGTVGDQSWWPRTQGSVVGTVAGAMFVGAGRAPGRPSARPDLFADAGIAILRTPPGTGPEIWCRCDGAPRESPSIAAHGHADALAVEVRHAGVEVLVDPGASCYHDDPRWRSYFRSTRAHNTVEIDGCDQSEADHPLLRNGRATAVVDLAEVGTDRPVQRWTAHHDGYARLRDPVGHRRTVLLDAAARRLEVCDALSGPGRHEVSLLFHLGPAVAVDLDGHRGRLTWPGPAGRVSAALDLPPELEWSAHRGEEEPPLGWYSSAFGDRVPAWTLVGRASMAGALSVRTLLAFPVADVDLPDAGSADTEG